jgi:hypothetical protein
MKRQRTGGHAGGNSGAKRRSRPGGRRDLAGGDGGGGTGDGGDGNWPCHVFIQIGPACGVFPVDVRGRGGQPVHRGNEDSLVGLNNSRGGGGSLSSTSSSSFYVDDDEEDEEEDEDEEDSDSDSDSDGDGSALEQLVRAAEPAVRGQARAHQAHHGGTGDSVRGTGHPLHISLSHGFTLRHHERKIFLDRLHQEFLQHPPFEVVVTDDVVSYVNRAGTRRFYALRVSGGKDIVVKLIHRVDKIMALFNHDKYHSDPKIHVSIAWSEETHVDEEDDNHKSTVGDEETHAGAKSRAGGEHGVEVTPTGVDCAFKVNAVSCRVGDAVHVIRL